jgi:hypothetical protein
MSLGQQFLARLNEAKAPAPVKKKAFTFDPAVETMKRGMRDIGGESDLADKIAEVMSLCGIPGIYLNKQDIKVSVVEAAQQLRTKSARVRSFLSLHSALCAFYGVEALVKEAKAEVAEFSDEELEGSQFQKMVEEILVLLGAPRELVTGEAKAPVKSSMKRAIAKLRQDENVRMAVLTLARYAGIKMNDGVAGEKKVGGPKKVAMEDVAAPAAAPAAPNMSNLWLSADSIFKHLGLNLQDEKLVRVVNMPGLIRAVKAASRNPQTKAAMIAFLNKTKAE